jgi:TetR/AcrR family transcriptional regulator, regulator of autoinduction and epiphytic fitness
VQQTYGSAVAQADVRTGSAPEMSEVRPDRSSDGRIARGIRARRAIAEALVALLQQGVERPTARQVAEQAGVSLRLVFHHFEDMESVLRSAVEIQVERHWRKLEAVSPDGDLGDRVNHTVRERAQLYEAIAPVRRAAGLAAGRSPTLAGQLDTARRLLRSQLRHTFFPELDTYGRGAPASKERELLDALEVATSFETWDQLRRLHGRSATAARRVVERLVTGVLDIEAGDAGASIAGKGDGPT